MMIPSDEMLVSRHLRKAGYFCGLIGKLHVAPCHPEACDGLEARIDDGFHRFDWSHHPSYFHKQDHPGNAYMSWLREAGGAGDGKPIAECQHVLKGFPHERHQTVWCVDRAVSFVNDAAAFDRPWFCSINFFDPHHPFDPPKEHLERYRARLSSLPLPVARGGAPATQWESIDRRGAYGGHAMPGELTDSEHRWVKAAYWAMCELIDEQVGRLIRHLRDTGVLDNTVIVYSSDHGEMLGDHGMYLKGPHFYEPAVRVPLLLRGPGVAATRIDDPVELIDVVPTILDLAGIQPWDGLQGRSLMPRIRGDVPLHREDAYCEFFNANFHYPEPAFGSMLRTRRHKLVKYHGSGQPCALLFDLEADPEEATNLWGDPRYGDLRSQLTERLCDRLALMHDPKPRASAPW
jgi:arylsulfatase A-like enzyme